MKLFDGIRKYNQVMKRLDQGTNQHVVQDAKQMREFYLEQMKNAKTQEEFESAKRMRDWCNDHIIKHGGISERRK